MVSESPKKDMKSSRGENKTSTVAKKEPQSPPQKNSTSRALSLASGRSTNKSKKSPPTKEAVSTKCEKQILASGNSPDKSTEAKSKSTAKASASKQLDKTDRKDNEGSNSQSKSRNKQSVAVRNTRSVRSEKNHESDSSDDEVSFRQGPSPLSLRALKLSPSGKGNTQRQQKQKEDDKLMSSDVKPKQKKPVPNEDCDTGHVAGSTRRSSRSGSVQSNVNSKPPGLTRQQSARLTTQKEPEKNKESSVNAISNDVKQENNKQGKDNKATTKNISSNATKSLTASNRNVSIDLISSDESNEEEDSQESSVVELDNSNEGSENDVEEISDEIDSDVLCEEDGEIVGSVKAFQMQLNALKVRHYNDLRRKVSISFVKNFPHVHICHFD